MISYLSLRLNVADHILTGKKVLLKPPIVENMAKVGIKNVLDCSKSLYVARNHSHLGHLIFRWSGKMHTYVPAWEKFTLTSEDLVVIRRFSIFRNRSTMAMFLEGDDKATLQDLISSMSSLRMSDKSTYTLRIRHFVEGVGSENGAKVEALL